MAYETILTDVQERVGVITLNRPDAMNALNEQLTSELAQAIAAFDDDDAIGCLVITGGEKAFAVGADIKEIQSSGLMDIFASDPIARNWEAVARCRKPIVAAVAGFALGGGCEIAMMCDLIVAAENAKFGQPEIQTGIMPGGGGTQRLAHAIGKAKTMDLCLTGRMLSAEEAERAGLISRVVKADDLQDSALSIAKRVAAMSRPAAMMTKEAVNRAFESPLNEGVRFERRLFGSLFALEDQKEGMAAFLEKRAPQFKNR